MEKQLAFSVALYVLYMWALSLRNFWIRAQGIKKRNFSLNQSGEPMSSRFF
jgi:hypothetical protein